MEYFNGDNNSTSAQHDGRLSPENYFFGLFDQGLIMSGKNSSGGLSSSRSRSSLVLDNERIELVTTTNLMKPCGQRVASANNADKALIALRNHSEAERRRRERINSHLATLRTLITGSNKMDKAALLAEVVKRVKELRNNTIEATNGTFVPTDIDEVKIEEEAEQNNPNNIASSSSSSSSLVRASLCCEFRHELLADLREALQTLPFKIESAEIASFENRMVFNVVVMSQNQNNDDREDKISGMIIGGGIEDQEKTLVLGESVHQALRSVLDKFYASEEYSSRNAMSGKRRRAASMLFDSSNKLQSASGSGGSEMW